MDQGAMGKKAAAAYLGISTRTLDRLIASGDIPIVKLARRLLIRKEALDAFLKSREHRRGHGEGEARQ
jgi:excisionase family DNA binding protein